MGIFSQLFAKPKGSIAPDAPAQSSGNVSGLLGGNPGGMTWADRLAIIGAGLKDIGGGSAGNLDAETKTIQNRQASAQQDQQRQQLMQMAKSMGLSPREMLTFMVNPQAWSTANAQRFGYHDQAPGSTATYGAPGEPDTTTDTAPVFGQEGGEGYELGPGGMKDMGGLAMSPSQQAVEAQRAQQAQLEADYHHQMAAAAEERAHAYTSRVGHLNSKPTGGSGGLPAGIKLGGW